MLYEAFVSVGDESTHAPNRYYGGAILALYDLIRPANGSTGSWEADFERDICLRVIDGMSKLRAHNWQATVGCVTFGVNKRADAAIDIAFRIEWDGYLIDDTVDEPETPYLAVNTPDNLMTHPIPNALCRLADENFDKVVTITLEGRDL